MLASILLLATLAQTTATSSASETGPVGSIPTSGIDWIVLPILQFNSDAGIIYGIHFPLVNYGDGHIRPYEWAYEMKLRHSTKNRHEHYAFLDLRDFLESRLVLRADFLRIDDANYFGIGHFARIDDVEAERFHYRRIEPRISLFVSRPISSDFRWGAGVTYNHVATQANEDSLLELERPLGYRGGHSLIGLASISFDTRDDELVPRHGVMVEVYGKAATRPLGSTFSFQGVGTTAQVYHAPVDWLVFAQRMMLETLGGRVPFYQLDRIGGSTNVFGLGGVFSQRGVQEARFSGRSKALANSEVRIYFPTLFDLVTLGMGAFFDVSLVFEGGRPSPSGGAEISVRWKKLVLFRIDGGLSREGTVIYVEGRHLF